MHPTFKYLSLVKKNEAYDPSVNLRFPFRVVSRLIKHELTMLFYATMSFIFFSVLCEDEKQAIAVKSQLQQLARPMYSNPPVHGALAVSTVLGDPNLKKLWLKEVKVIHHYFLLTLFLKGIHFSISLLWAGLAFFFFFFFQLFKL